MLRTLWVDNPSSFHGETYDLPDCEMFPKPVQQPHPPIHVGGETAAAMRRVARLGQGWHTFNRSPAALATGLAELDVHLKEAGRSRADLQITVCPYFQPLTPEAVEGYVEAGADAVAALFFAFTAEDVARAFDDLEACRETALRTRRLRGRRCSSGGARCASCSGRTTSASPRRPRAWQGDRKPGPARSESAGGMIRPPLFHPWG